MIKFRHISDLMSLGISDLVAFAIIMAKVPKWSFKSERATPLI